MKKSNYGKHLKKCKKYGCDTFSTKHFPYCYKHRNTGKEKKSKSWIANLSDETQIYYSLEAHNEALASALHSYRTRLAGLVEGLMCGPSDGDCPNTGCDSLKDVLNIIRTTEIGERE